MHALYIEAISTVRASGLLPSLTFDNFCSFQENMTRMLLVVDVQDIIKKHQAQIITSLKDPDIRYFFSPISTRNLCSHLTLASLLILLFNRWLALLSLIHRF